MTLTPSTGAEAAEQSSMRLVPPWFLLSDSKQIDFVALIWHLDNRTTENSSLWWPGSKCSQCENRAVRWNSVNGYQCEDCLGLTSVQHLFRG
jgi:hypothetical protein